MKYGRFHWDDATCRVQLSDGRIETVTTYLVCEAQYDHYFEKLDDYYGYEEFWEIYPIEETVKPLAPDEFIVNKQENDSDVFIVKVLDYDDANGWEWELAA